MSKEIKEITATLMLPVSVTMFVEFERDEEGEIDSFEVKRIKRVNPGGWTAQGIISHMSDDDFDYIVEKIELNI